MVAKDTIKVYCRVRPISKKKKKSEYNLAPSLKTLTLSKKDGKTKKKGAIIDRKYKYEHIFDTKTNQATVFDICAKNSVQASFDGYNSTIFAYGQTGSGKTYTMTGGPMKISQRGVIPRSLSYVFQKIEEHEGPEEFTISISYMEIYNNKGYDLLYKGRKKVKKLQNLPKVRAFWDAKEKSMELSNLKQHVVRSEEQACQLLFHGDSNRIIVETDMNVQSSRSHCIFTIHIEKRVPGEKEATYGKLNLVDLAGSESISKSKAKGRVLKEAKSINVSLFYLKQVIEALRLKKKHVPYRNSLMTRALHDSLGGNSVTAMIATITPEARHLNESISTCDFAQSVSSIKQTATKNQRMDSKSMIKKLKSKIAKLKEKNSYLSAQDQVSGGGKSKKFPPLDDQQRSEIKSQVDAYSYGTIDILKFGANYRAVQEAFRLLRQLVQQGREKISMLKEEVKTLANAKPTEVPYDEKIEQLTQHLLQRDFEIDTLVDMLSRKRLRKSTTGTQTSSDDINSTEINRRQSSSGMTIVSNPTYSKEKQDDFITVRSSVRQQMQGEASIREKAAPKPSRTLLKKIAQISEDVSDRVNSFSLFKTRYKENEKIETDKQELKEMYQQAKDVAQQIKSQQYILEQHKQQLLKLRAERSVVFDSTRDPDVLEQLKMEQEIREQDLIDRIDKEKQKFMFLVTTMKDLKKNIKHGQMGLSVSRDRVQAAFGEWMTSRNLNEQVTPAKKEPTTKKDEAGPRPILMNNLVQNESLNRDASRPTNHLVPAPSQDTSPLSPSKKYFKSPSSRFSQPSSYFKKMNSKSSPISPQKKQSTRQDNSPPLSKRYQHDFTPPKRYQDHPPTPKRRTSPPISSLRSSKPSLLSQSLPRSEPTPAQSASSSNKSTNRFTSRLASHQVGSQRNPFLARLSALKNLHAKVNQHHS